VAPCLFLAAHKHSQDLLREELWLRCLEMPSVTAIMRSSQEAELHAARRRGVRNAHVLSATRTKAYSCAPLATLREQAEGDIASRTKTFGASRPCSAT